MNKVFKVIWSEARNAYVVVSEMAKSHGTKSCSTKKLLAMLIATGVMTCASVAPVMAATTVADDATVNVGNKAGVNLADGATLSVAQGSNVSVAENITMGKGAKVAVWNGVSGQTISGDIAVGPNAYAWNGEYTYKDKYARIGSKEYLLDFAQGGVVGAELFR